MYHKGEFAASVRMIIAMTRLYIDPPSGQCSTIYIVQWYDLTIVRVLC